MTSSQVFETYQPIYEEIPENWNEAKDVVTENFRRIANQLNEKEIGFYLDEELLAGSQFIGATSTPQQYRSIFRKTYSIGPIAAGANTQAHGITFDSNFSLIKLWVAVTDTTGFTAQIITGSDVTMDATNININSPGAFDVAYIMVEYLKEPS